MFMRRVKEIRQPRDTLLLTPQGSRQSLTRVYVKDDRSFLSMCNQSVAPLFMGLNKKSNSNSYSIHSTNFDT